mgnify:CR=1 FL=1
MAAYDSPRCSVLFFTGYELSDAPLGLPILDATVHYHQHLKQELKNLHP